MRVAGDGDYAVTDPPGLRSEWTGLRGGGWGVVLQGIGSGLHCLMLAVEW